MRVLISAAGGLLGAALRHALTARGHEVVRLVRRAAAPGDVSWDPAAGMLAAGAVSGFDAVIHLSGEPLVGRWTARKKGAIYASRVTSTAVLARALAATPRPPAAWLVASAMGIYGDRGAEPLTEESAPGADWLAGVCREWEAAAAPAQRRGIRVVHLRSGLVLSARGGSLGQMLPFFRLGLGGPVGTGRAYWSWIAIDDVVAAVLHVLGSGSLRGPVNFTTPHPVTSGEFARVLGRVLHRPALVPVPPFLLRLLFGEGAAPVLTSSRVLPAKLQASGFVFSYPDLEPALRHLLGREKDA